MELVTCPNCLAVYGDVQTECSLCGADPQGEGAELEFDSGTRAAIAGIGGLYGGILAAGAGTHLLWCARGVCRVDDEIGLVWATRTRALLESVNLEGEIVRLSTARGVARIDLADGTKSGR